MPIFPLAHRPAASYHESPRSFGCGRANGARQHAGCDLYASPNTGVLAVEDGVIIAGPYLFYDVVLAIEVKHASGIIVRYGEISGVAEGIKAGVAVKSGQVIGYVGKMQTVPQSMLHFELFSGKANGPLTDRSHGPFMRRSDLVNPTAFLDSCIVEPATPAALPPTHVTS